MSRKMDTSTQSTFEEDWDDLLGTGTVLRQVVEPGRRPDEDEDDGITHEAPRKFFALIDVEITIQGRLLESYKNFLINNDADLFPGAHLVIPLMDLDETSRFKFDAKFAYGQKGDAALQIPPNALLECLITLHVRAPYDQFLEQLTANERFRLAERKRERGRFWFLREDYELAISMFQSMADLCNYEPGTEVNSVSSPVGAEDTSRDLSSRLDQVRVS